VTLTWSNMVQLVRSIGDSLPSFIGLEQTAVKISSAPGSVIITAAGTGYTNGAKLTIIGGMPATYGGHQAQFTATASGGLITGLTVDDPGLYSTTTFPGNTNVPLIGDAGTGATINIVWQTTSALIN